MFVFGSAVFRAALVGGCMTLAALFPAAASPVEAKVLDAVAIMHQPASNNICAITFDDGPTSFTGHLLDSLQSEGVRATFFLLGQQITRRPELVRRMAEEGHEVASHGYSHPNMRKLSAEARHEELASTNTLLAELGITPRYFRPPYGKYDANLAAMAQEMGMSVIMWTTDSRDWKRRPDYSNMPNISGKRMQREEMRGVFLFHDTKQSTVQDVRRMLADLRAGGCERFVTVSEYFSTLDVEEPQMTARPDIPQRELDQVRRAAAQEAAPPAVEPGAGPSVSESAVGSLPGNAAGTSGQGLNRQQPPLLYSNHPAPQDILPGLPLARE